MKFMYVINDYEFKKAFGIFKEKVDFKVVSPFYNERFKEIGVVANFNYSPYAKINEEEIYKKINNIVNKYNLDLLCVKDLESYLFLKKLINEDFHITLGERVKFIYYFEKIISKELDEKECLIIFDESTSFDMLRKIAIRYNSIFFYTKNEKLGQKAQEEILKETGTSAYLIKNTDFFKKVNVVYDLSLYNLNPQMAYLTFEAYFSLFNKDKISKLEAIFSKVYFSKGSGYTLNESFLEGIILQNNPQKALNDFLDEDLFSFINENGVKIAT